MAGFKSVYSIGWLGSWHTLPGFIVLAFTMFLWAWAYCGSIDVLASSSRSYFQMMFNWIWVGLGAIGLIVVYLTNIRSADASLRSKGTPGQTTQEEAQSALKHGRSGLSDKFVFIAVIVLGLLTSIAATVQYAIPAPVGSAAVDMVVPTLGSGDANVTWDEMRTYNGLKEVDRLVLNYTAIVMVVFFVPWLQLAYVVGRLLTINSSSLNTDGNSGNWTHSKPFSANVNNNTPGPKTTADLISGRSTSTA